MNRLIVLCSGWTGAKSSWYFMKRRFEEEGYDCIQTVYPYRGYTPIQYSARSIGKLVENIRPQYDHCTIIGHSMGGLVGRYLLQRTPYGENIDSYVSLGTPHQGVYLAKYLPPIGGMGKSARQMAYGSGFIERLNATSWPERVPALAVSGGLEDIVWPHSSTSLEFAENVTIPWVNHISLVIDKRVFQEVSKWLKAEESVQSV